jgi:hypothetical protein
VIHQISSHDFQIIFNDCANLLLTFAPIIWHADDNMASYVAANLLFGIDAELRVSAWPESYSASTILSSLSPTLGAVFVTGDRPRE